MGVTVQIVEFCRDKYIPPCTAAVRCRDLPLYTPDSDGEVPHAAEVVGAGDVAEDGVGQVVGDDHGVVGHRSNL